VDALRQNSLRPHGSLDCHGGSKAYALGKSPRPGGNLFRISIWEPVFPNGGSHEVRAKGAVAGAIDTHNR
jgi:hypothetical protein